LLDISKDLNYLISSKYAYIILKENRNVICNKLFPNEIPTHTDEFDNINNFDDFHSSISSETCSDDTLNFNITLSAEEWGSLYDNKPQIYKRSNQKSEYRSYSDRYSDRTIYYSLINGPQQYMSIFTNKLNFLAQLVINTLKYSRKVKYF
jgi:hypothetical protein